jgi:hypothetical protein
VTVNLSQKFNNISVALLMEDLAQAKAFSEVLREFGIFAHYHRDLDEFWVAANTQTPDLAIIDVKKMSQGTLLLKNHPKLIEAKLNLAFYFKAEDRYLANSTFQISNFGLIDSSMQLAGQVEAILHRLTKELDFKRRNMSLSERVQRLQTRSNRILSDLNENIQLQQRQQQIVKFSSAIEQRMIGSDFSAALVSTLSEWDVIEKFSFYELNQSGQKLVSADFVRSKFIEFPSLWLGKDLKNGIDSFAIEMAHQVANEMMSSNFICLQVKSKYNQPELLVYIAQNTEITDAVDWKMMEILLSSTFRKYQLMRSQDTSVSRFMNPYDALSIQDEIHFQQRQADVKLININFAALMDVVRAKYSNRFFWKAFWREFMTQMDDVLTEDTYFSSYGADNLMIFSEREHFESNFMNLDKFIKDFSYWKFFEDSSLVLTSDVTPSLKLLPPSSLNYLRFIDEEGDSARQLMTRTAHRATQILSSREV